MTTPTLTNTWYSRGNVPFPSTTSSALIAQSWAWLLKALLKDEVSTGSTSGVRPVGAKWTCVGSSDGTTAALDGVDRWTNAFDASKLVLAANGVAHSWIVLQSPAAMGPVYMCIDLNSATAGTFGISFSRTAMTGGSTTSRATSANDIQWGSTTTATAATQQIYVQDTTSGNFGLVQRAHFTITDTGEFHFATSKDTAGIFNAYGFALNAVDTTAGDTHPLWVGWHGVNSGRGSGQYSGLSAVSGITGRTANNSVSNTGGGAVNWTFGTANFSSTAVADGLMAQFMVLPIFMFQMVAPNYAWRGRLPDIFATSLAAVGSSFPTTAAPTQHVVGEVLVPFGVVPYL